MPPTPPLPRKRWSLEILPGGEPSWHEDEHSLLSTLKMLRDMPCDDPRSFRVSEYVLTRTVVLT